MFPDTYAYIGILEYGEEGSVGVRFPDLPGCIAVGDTPKKRWRTRNLLSPCTFTVWSRTGNPSPPRRISAA